MKKVLFTLTLMFFTSIIAFSQYYYLPSINAGQNPGGLNTDAEYPKGSGLDASWTLVLSGNKSTPTWSTSQTIPFSFSFNGNTVTSFKISSSGILSFAQNVGTAPTYVNDTLPNSAIPDSSVCIWGVKGSGSNDNIMTKTFGTAPNRQLWLFFSSYNWNGGASNVWTYWSIVLEETSNKIYIVDQRTGNGSPSLTLGIQINNTTAYQVAGSPSVANNAGTNAQPSDNSFYTFIPGVQPQKDIKMLSIDVPPYLSVTNAPFDITGSFVNNGTDTITSFDLSYQVDNNTIVTSNITGVNITSMSNYSFTHPTKWNGAVGNYNIKVWTSNINGGTDANPQDDTLNKAMQVVANMVQRMPLYETFTSSTCGPCVAGNTNMDALFAANPNKWVCVKYQMSWPGSGDPYYTAEGGIRRQFYGVNSVPRQEIDGGYDGNSSSVTQADFDAAYAIPAFMGITADMVLGGHMVTVNYTIDPKIDFPANAKLYIAIVEKKTYNNTGSNGETEFHWVMKKMLPNGSGSTIGPLTANTTVTNSVSYAFNGPYRLPNNAGDPIDHTKENSVEDFNNLIAVVWVQNPTTKEVYQSALSSFTIGMDKAERDNLIKSVYPNPAQNQVNIDLNMEQSENVDVSIFNTLGQIVINKQFGSLNGANTLKINLGNLSQGIYFVKIQVGNKIYTKPLTVK
jgi:hypothetical protein